MRSLLGRFSLQLVVALVLIIVSLDRPMLGQTASERPRVTPTPLPSLLFDVWPADFDRDGETDLVAARADGTLVVRLGAGDGAFENEVTAASAPMRPKGVGDLNGDTFTDIVAVGGGTDPGALYVVPGRGDGTFEPARAVAEDPFQSPVRTALLADYDGDGRRDMALVESVGAVILFPNTGNFTFGAAIPLPAGEELHGAVAADLNGDSRIDIAVAGEYSRSVEVLLNQGSLTFVRSTIPLDRAGLGLTAWDLNGDGARELIVGAGDFENLPGVWTTGFVYVLRANGDGTFQPPLVFQTNRGPVSVVAGDFNGDGRADVATGNRSDGYNFGCDLRGQLWDSVSILAGNGDGTLGAAGTFALGSSRDPSSDDKRIYRDRLHGLRTNDVDKDGRTDLIVSPGMVLFNDPPGANRPPVADAGPDRLEDPNPGPGGWSLRGSAFDPDRDWLSFTWTDESGHVVSTDPEPCINGEYGHDETFTLTVSDGHGGISRDAATLDFDGADVRFIAPLAAENVTPGVAYRIRWTADTNPDHWNLFVWTDFGDSPYPIDECQGVPGTARECLWHSPGPRTAFAVVELEAHESDGSYRLWSSGEFRIGYDTDPRFSWGFIDIGAVSADGSTIRDDSTGTVTVRGSGADIWGSADEFHFTSTLINGDLEITARVVSVQNVHQWTKAGLMVREQGGGRPESARHASLFVTPTTVKGVAFQRREVAGGTSVHTAGPPYTAPVWLRLRRIGDQVSAFVRRSPEEAWSVIGSQQFDNLEATLHVGLAVSSHVDGRLATAVFDNVTVTRLVPQRLDVIAPAAGEEVPAGRPYIIRWNATRDASYFLAAYSLDDGATWQATTCGDVLGSARACQWIPPATTSDEARVQLSAFHDEGDTVTGVSERFRLVPADAGGTLPIGWDGNDIGAVAAAGSASYAGGVFTVSGSGADIWGTSDELHLVSKALALGVDRTDFELTARVLSVENVNQWTKVGLMARDHQGTGASHASLFVTPTTTKGIAFQRRRTAGGSTLHTAGPALTAPVWLKLLFTAGTVRAFYRDDRGGPWTFVGQDHITITGSDLEFGLAVSSHVDGRLARATFDHVSVRPLSFWNDQDIGAVGVTGLTTDAGATVTLHGSGADIWSTADAFRGRWASPTPSRIAARVLDVESTHVWAKAGVMMRETSAAGSRHAMLIVSPGRGLAMQYRASTNGTSANVALAPGAAPKWVALRRTETHFVGEVSNDGVVWTEVGRVTIAMPTYMAGLVVTSHDNARLASATFDDIVLQSPGSEP